RLCAPRLDPAIKAPFVSVYFTIFRECIMSISHCIDNYIPGLLNWAEMYDIAGLIAPRPVFFESGERDNIFPIAASRESFGRVRLIYEVFGASDLTGHEVFDRPHRYSGRQRLPVFIKHLAAV